MQTLKINALITAAIVQLCSMSATAITDEALFLHGEEQFFIELPSIVSVTRLSQSRDALPASVTIIDRRMIENSGAVELTDLFKLVPGFQVGHYHDVDGSRTAVTYHGNSDQYSRRMQVLVDGRSIYTQLTGGPEWPDLPITIDDIERIEVIRGPNGVAYGMNAFQGVINIITRHPDSYSGSNGIVQLGERDNQRLTVRYVDNDRDFKYTLKASKHSSSGYRDLDLLGNGVNEINDNSSTNLFTFRGDYQSDVNDFLTFYVGSAEGPRQVGLMDQFAPNKPGPDSVLRNKLMSNTYQHITWKHIFDSESELNLHVYHNLHKSDDRYSVWYSDILTYVDPTKQDIDYTPAILLSSFGVVDKQLAIDTSLYSERSNVELSYQRRFNEKMRVVWGGEARADTTKENDYLDITGKYTRHSNRLFYNFEYQPIDSIVINLGDMFESSDVISDNLHSPRIALNMRLSGQRYLRFSRSRAWRSPVFLEERMKYQWDIPDILLNVPLIDHSSVIKPERIYSTEVAYGHYSDTTGFNYDVRLFQDNVTNLITLPKNQITKEWVFENDGSYTMNGVDLDLNYVTESGIQIHLAHSSVSVEGQIKAYTNPNVYDDFTLFVPKYTTSILVSKRLNDRMNVALNYYNVAAMEFFSGDNTGGYRTMDIAFKYKLKRDGGDASITLLGKNLTEPYFDYEDETALERTYYLTFETKF